MITVMSEAHLVYGRDLRPDELEIINRQRKLEFGSNRVIDPRPSNDDWDKPYFLVRSEGGVAAFGRLHAVQVEFRGMRHVIWGIATVIAVEKGRGYGMMLMQKMKQYIVDSDTTGVGFCDPVVFPFYTKCGFSMLTGGIGRFEFLDSNGQTIVPSHARDMAFFVDGSDHIGRDMQGNPADSIVAFRAAW
jgi:hypothetical protein